MYINKISLCFGSVVRNIPSVSIKSSFYLIKDGQRFSHLGVYFGSITHYVPIISKTVRICK